MDMQERPRGTLALVLLTMAIGVYSQLAAMALLMAGLFIAGPGSDASTYTLLLGALYLATAAGACTVAVGTWRLRPWARQAGLLVYGSFILDALLLAAVSGNTTSAIIPTLTSLLALGLLLRPVAHARLAASGVTDVLGEDATALSSPAVLDTRLLSR